MLTGQRKEHQVRILKKEDRKNDYTIHIHAYATADLVLGYISLTLHLFKMGDQLFE